MTEQAHNPSEPEPGSIEVSPKTRRDNAQAEIDRMLHESEMIHALDQGRRGDALERLSQAQAELALLDEGALQAPGLRQAVENVLKELDVLDEQMKAWQNATDIALLGMARIIEENKDQE